MEFTRKEICEYLNDIFKKNLDLILFIKHRNYLFLRFRNKETEFSIEKTENNVALNIIKNKEMIDLDRILSLFLEDTPKAKYDLVYTEKTLNSYLWSNESKEEIAEYLLSKSGEEYSLKNICFLENGLEEKKLH